VITAELINTDDNTTASKNPAIRAYFFRTKADVTTGTKSNIP